MLSLREKFVVSSLIGLNGVLMMLGMIFWENAFAALEPVLVSCAFFGAFLAGGVALLFFGRAGALG